MVATMTNPLRVGLRQERVIAPQCLVTVSYTHLTLPTIYSV